MSALQSGARFEEKTPVESVASKSKGQAWNKE